MADTEPNLKQTKQLLSATKQNAMRLHAQRAVADPFFLLAPTLLTEADAGGAVASDTLFDTSIK